jgi:ribonuclease Z
VFDLGDISRLSPRDILKISHLFISHTHMDHFIGFDRLLRIVLGREKTLFLYGPEGFLKNMEGKLAAYTWNLVKNFSGQLVIHATEITEDALISQRYACQDGFTPIAPPGKAPYRGGPLLEEAAFRIRIEILDHGIPSLGFSLAENFHVNIRKEALESSGMLPGPWLLGFKQALFEAQDGQKPVAVPCEKTGRKFIQEFALQELAERIALITRGQKIAYAADAAYTAENVEKIIRLAWGADHLFIESAFLEKDRSQAAAKQHLTARQAGEIAGLARVKRFTLFHFSPRYEDPDPIFYGEAGAAFEKNRRDSDLLAE